MRDSLKAAAMALLFGLGLAAGCQGTTAPELAPPEVIVEIDPVCEHNGDLPCVRVTVTPETPRLDYRGRTYYFCTEACRRAFERDPERYLNP